MTWESVVITLFFLVTHLLVSLLDEGKSDTFTSWEGDGCGLAVTDDDDVAHSGGERVAVDVLNVDDIVGTDMLLDGGDHTNSTDVVSASEGDVGTVGHLDDAIDGEGGEVELDGITDADVWVWVSDGSTVVGDDVRDLVLTNGLLHDLAELEGGLLGVNSVRDESTLDVEEDSEVLVGLVNGDNVHVSEWESVVSSDLSVNLDVSILVVGNLSALVSGESVLESLLEKNSHWDALSKLVWTSGWSGGVDTLELAEVPHLWCGDSLDNLSLTFVTHLDKF